MSQLEWSHDGDVWSAVCNAISSGEDFFMWHISVTDDGMFSMTGTDTELLSGPPKSYQTLSMAKLECQSLEDELAAQQAQEAAPAVNITGPCMGRMRDGQIVKITPAKEDYVWRKRGFVCWTGTNGVNSQGRDDPDGDDSDHDIIEIWPLPESEKPGKVVGLTADNVTGDPLEAARKLGELLNKEPASHGRIMLLEEPQMSLRDWFAGQVLASLPISTELTNKEVIELVDAAYTVSDAMLKARGQ